MLMVIGDGDIPCGNCRDRETECVVSPSLVRGKEKSSEQTGTACVDRTNPPDIPPSTGPSREVPLPANEPLPGLDHGRMRSFRKLGTRGCGAFCAAPMDGNSDHASRVGLCSSCSEMNQNQFGIDITTAFTSLAIIPHAAPAEDCS